MENRGPGDGTSNHLNQATYYITAPLDTVLNNADVPRLTRENKSSDFTAVLPGQNNFQHGLLHFCLNKTSLNSSTTGQTFLLQTPTFKLQTAFPASTITNFTQQSHLPHIIVLNNNDNNPNGNSINLNNQQRHVQNSPKDLVQQRSFTDVNFGVISAQAQTTSFHQQNACVAKDVFQQKYASSKAIAVVTPLTPKEVVGVSLSKNIPPKKVGGLESEAVSNKKDGQCFVQHTSQRQTNENDANSLDDSTFHTWEVPSNLAHSTRVSHFAEDDGHNTVNNPPVSRTTLAVVDSRLVVPPYHKSSAKPLTKENSTVITSAGTRMEARKDTLATIPVKEWSLQRLQTFIIALEQMEQNEQKDLPFDDLASEIVKLYWNGDSQEFCNATNLYTDIMKEARVYCGIKNSIILQEVLKERLNEIASNVQILKPDTVSSKVVHTLSLVNLIKKPFDIEKEQNNLSSLMALSCKTNTVASKKVPVEEMENVQRPSNENIKTSNKALSGEEEQRKPLPQEHPKNLSAIGDKVVRNEQEDRHVNNAFSGKETEGQNDVTVNNMLVKESEKLNSTKFENEAPLLKSTNIQNLCAKLNTDKNAIADGMAVELSILEPDKVQQPGVNAENMQKEDAQILPAIKVQVTAQLLDQDNEAPLLKSTNIQNLCAKLTTDKNAIADGMAVKLSSLEPDEAGQPGVNEDNMQKEDAQILPASKVQVATQLLDQDKEHMDTEIKSDEKSSGVKINCQLENYCCVSKWFQVLGYRNVGHCKCEKKAELGQYADISYNNVQVNIDKNTKSFNKACTSTSPDICAMQDNNQARFQNRSMTEKHLGTLSDDDDDDDADSIKDLKIVDVITNNDDVCKIANAMSEQLTEAPLISGEKPCHKKIPTAKFKTREKRIKLALFGTVHQRQKKSTSEFTSSDSVPLPPETINIQIDSDHPKSRTLKQQVWDSWNQTYVASKMFTNRRSKKWKISKPAKLLKSKNHAEDNPVRKLLAGVADGSGTKCENAFSLASAGKRNNTSTNKSKNKRSLTRKDQSKKLKRERKFALLNLKKRWKYAHYGSTFMKSSFDLAPVISTSKNKVNTDLALNFGVLPESFNISEEPRESTTEAVPLENTDCGSKVNPAKRRLGISGRWCESPRKKHCLKPTQSQPNTSRMSTFQEFKKKYEEKNLIS